jgi:hypothetical protein
MITLFTTHAGDGYRASRSDPSSNNASILIARMAMVGALRLRATSLHFARLAQPGRRLGHEGLPLSQGG